ncbi:MAG: cupin domain-containing protein [Phycisphaerales bacterium]|nr:cupin domain-containing protein [Phycisphaerales bacterium]
MRRVLQLDGIEVPGYHGGPINGREAFLKLTTMASTALSRFKAELARRRGDGRGAAVGCIRGTGLGVSFGALVDALERDEPRDLQGPFESTDSISGAVWMASDLLGPVHDTALLKLRFEKGTDKLPLHAHLHSDRVIFVLSGRGFYHASSEPMESFTGCDVQSIAVRERDALVFTRGVIHTFTAPTEPLVLLSFHAPFIPLDQPDQYTVPVDVVRFVSDGHSPNGLVGCVPAWTLLVGS